MTTLQQLLKYFHTAVFDTKPDSVLAFRLRHASGATWSVSEDVFTATAGSVTHSFDLNVLTINDLALVLQAAGFEVLNISTNISHLGAACLVEGSGDQNISNGDHVMAFMSPLWAILSSYAVALRDADYARAQALRQMIITQADGDWLDLWGTLYATARLAGESDVDYAARIPEEAFRLRVNGKAIEKAVKDLTGYDIEIKEPWKSTFRLDFSQLSGTDYFENADYYAKFLIQPVADHPIDWTKPLEVIKRNKAAGIMLLDPASRYASGLEYNFTGMYQVLSGRKITYTESAIIAGNNPLDVVVLSDDFIIKNYPVVWYGGVGHANFVGLGLDVDTSQKIMGLRNTVFTGVDGSLVVNETVITEGYTNFNEGFYAARTGTPPTWTGAWDSRAWYYPNLVYSVHWFRS